MTFKEFSSDYSPTLQAIAAFLALLSLVQVWWQIRKGNAWNRTAAAFGLLDVDRFDALEKTVIAECEKIGIEFPKELTPDDAKVIREKHDAYHAIKAFIIFIECLGVSVTAGYADEGVIYSTYGAVVQGYYKVLKGYIVEVRADEGPQAYEDFEKVAMRFEERSRKLGRIPVFRRVINFIRCGSASNPSC
jgi:hypothetical protein